MNATRTVSKTKAENSLKETSPQNEKRQVSEQRSRLPRPADSGHILISREEPILRANPDQAFPPQPVADLPALTELTGTQ